MNFKPAIFQKRESKKGKAGKDGNPFDRKNPSCYGKIDLSMIFAAPLRLVVSSLTLCITDLKTLEI